jgi:single stranded DNA-binding protein (ssb)
MNKVILSGRFTKDPVVAYSRGENAVAVAKFSLAVDRRFKKEGEEQGADFPNCTAFGKTAEFIEKYFRKGVKASVIGRLQTGSYINKQKVKVYTTDVIIEEIEFAESKRDNEQVEDANEGFMNIAGEDAELPFA